MLTKTYKITCDECGRYIPYQDLAGGKATHKLAEPDSDLSRESFESECARCRAKHTGGMGGTAT